MEGARVEGERLLCGAPILLLFMSRGKDVVRSPFVAVVALDAHRSGLPCRAPDCDDVIPVPDNCGPKLFLVLCRARVDHEANAHQYVHIITEPPKRAFSWAKSSRTVLKGQEI